MSKKQYKKHNWNALKLEYMENNISLNDLAGQHGIRPSYLREVAATKAWTRAKDTFEQNVSIKQADLVGDELARYAVERKLRYLEVYGEVFDLGRKELNRLIEHVNETGNLGENIRLLLLLLSIFNKARAGERLELGELANMTTYPVASTENSYDLNFDPYELRKKFMHDFDRIIAAKERLEAA